MTGKPDIPKPIGVKPVPQNDGLAEKVAALEATRAAHHDDIRELKEAVKGLGGDVKELLEIAHTSKAGFRALLMFGGILTAAAAAGAWLWDHYPHK